MEELKKLETLVSIAPRVETLTNVTLKEDVKLRPALVDEFLELDKSLKILAAEHETKKAELKKFILQYGGYDDIYVSSRGGKGVFNPETLYQWLTTIDHEVAERVCPKTIRTVNEAELDNCYLEALFTLDDIPAGCYSRSRETKTLEIPENRKRKNKDDVKES